MTRTWRDLFRAIAAVVACVTLGLVTVAVEASRQAATSDPRVASGKRLFNETCATEHCHGGPARNVADMSGLTTDQIRRIVLDGLPGAGMQPFKGVFEPDQLDAVVAYVASASGSAAAAASPDAAPALRGDAARGRVLFFEGTQARACIGCHSLEGRGGSVGPELTAARGKPARDLFRSIVMRETHAAAIMPTDEYASRYSLQQLLDLVAFLKASSSDSAVALKDVL